MTGIKGRGGHPVRFAVASVLGFSLALAAPALAAPNKPHPTTTTITTPTKTNEAFAKLVIKASSIGHVNAKTAGSSSFKPAKNGQSLHVGDTVQTDATGKAEIDYADTAWTRLDVNTTFTIKKLTDAQGNRQVDGSLDVGRTYNRTAALTQSQMFQQDGGGATAAVAGTAFVVSCTSATSCTFTAVIDTINLTGTDGKTKTLNPLDQCDANNGALCATTTHLTPDELALIQWIQENVYLDLVEHGIGDGVFQPFAGTVTVNNGTVQTFAPFTPTTPPPPLPPTNPFVDSTGPIQTAAGAPAYCDPPGNPCLGINDGGNAPNPFVFTINTGNATHVQFNVDNLPATVGALTQGIAPVVNNQLYPVADQFTFTPNTSSGGSGSFTVQARNISPAPENLQIPVTIPVAVGGP